MKIQPLGAHLFHADKHDEAIRSFSQFCERAFQKASITT